MPKNKIVKSDKSKEPEIVKTPEEKLQSLAVQAVMNGEPRSLVVNKIKNDYWELGLTISEEEAISYYQNIELALKQYYDEQKKKLPEFLYNAYMDIYREARVFRDNKTALSCLSSLERIAGIGQEKINIASEGPVKISFGFGGNAEEDAEEVNDEIE